MIWGYEHKHPCAEPGCAERWPCTDPLCRYGPIEKRCDACLCRLARKEARAAETGKPKAKAS